MITDKVLRFVYNNILTNIIWPCLTCCLGWNIIRAWQASTGNAICRNILLVSLYNSLEVKFLRTVVAIFINAYIFGVVNFEKDALLLCECLGLIAERSSQKCSV